MKVYRLKPNNPPIIHDGKAILICEQSWYPCCTNVYSLSGKLLASLDLIPPYTAVVIIVDPDISLRLDWNCLTFC